LTQKCKTAGKLNLYRCLVDYLKRIEALGHEEALWVPQDDIDTVFATFGLECVTDIDRYVKYRYPHRRFGIAMSHEHVIITRLDKEKP